jgi:hypothetical protein
MSSRRFRMTVSFHTGLTTGEAVPIDAARN